MRFSLCRSLTLVLALAAVVALGGAAPRARAGGTPLPTARDAVLRAGVDDYRRITWTYDDVARVPRTKSAYSDRRSHDIAYLRWVLAAWERRSDLARRRALRSLDRRLGIRLPSGPSLRSPAVQQLAYSSRLTSRLLRIYPGSPRELASAGPPGLSLRASQLRAAAAALAVSRHLPVRTRLVRDWLTAALVCIHAHEGAWTSNTGNGYYGGLQMDRSFQRRYGADFVVRWGTADNWPAWAQIIAARRAYAAGRGFAPWPNSSRACRL